MICALTHEECELRKSHIYPKFIWDFLKDKGGSRFRSINGNNRVELNGNPNMSNLKEAAQNLIDHIASIEDTFTGRLQSECVIDPIAIYREIMIPTQKE